MQQDWDLDSDSDWETPATALVAADRRLGELDRLHSDAHFATFTLILAPAVILTLQSGALSRGLSKPSQVPQPTCYWQLETLTNTIPSHPSPFKSVSGILWH